MDPNADPRLSKQLAEDLSSLFRAEVHVPPEVERTILSGVRAHLARRHRWVRWVAAGSAVAAVLLISFALVRQHAHRQVAQNAVISVSSHAGDANGDGRIDIRDALALARRIDAGSVTPTARDDVNGDRVIDRKDVDAIAMMAVSIGAEVVR
jgi:hypothetical protein